MYRLEENYGLYNNDRNVKNRGISSRRISLLCSQGRVPGAEKKGKTWLIPKDAVKPTDPRRKNRWRIGGYNAYGKARRFQSEDSALVHFTRLGYTYMSIKDKECNVDYDGDTNIFYSQFLSAVNRINQTELTLEDAKKIIGELKIKLDNDDLGKSFFKILQSGIDGIKLIDFSDITGQRMIIQL